MNYLKEIIVRSFDPQAKTYVDKSNATKSTEPRTAYLVPNAFGKHDRWVSDDNGVLNKQGENETLTTVEELSLQGNTLTLRYKGEDSNIQTKSVGLQGLVTVDIHITDAKYDASQNVITLTDNQGKEYKVDLSEFSILTETNPEGVTTLTQEGVEKLKVSKAGQTGDYNDLLNKPNIPEIPEHNNLQGLQGGTTGEYYHLTQAQHEFLTTREEIGVWDTSSTDEEPDYYDNGCEDNGTDIDLTGKSVIQDYEFNDPDLEINKLFIPETVVKIGEMAFHSIGGSIESICIPDSVQEIGAGAFNLVGSTLKNVRLPNGITTCLLYTSDAADE